MRKEKRSLRKIVNNLQIPKMARDNVQMTQQKIKLLQKQGLHKVKIW